MLNTAKTKLNNNQYKRYYFLYFFLIENIYLKYYLKI